MIQIHAANIRPLHLQIRKDGGRAGKRLEGSSYLTEYRTCSRADKLYGSDTNDCDQSQHKAIFNHRSAILVPKKSFDSFHCFSFCDEYPVFHQGGGCPGPTTPNAYTSRERASRAHVKGGEQGSVLRYGSNVRRLHPQIGWVKQSSKKSEGSSYLSEYRACSRADKGYGADTNDRDQSQHKTVFNQRRAFLILEKSFNSFHCFSPSKFVS